MKKYIFAIITMGIILCGILIYNVMRVQTYSTKTFYDSGYILKSANVGSEAQNVERYYFNEDQTYQIKYDQKVIFDNTEGEQVTTEKNNFIHYSDGSVSSFTNGVILNLNEIDKDPIQYYNISAFSVLEKNGEYYMIQNLDKTLNFTDIIWKIDSNKYIILSNNIKLIFNETETKEISGYVELEYLDNEIVKIYNQEATYQTVSSKAHIELLNNVKIVLNSKIVTKNNENKMSLENMVIDSEDNIKIVDLSQEEAEDGEEEQNGVANNEQAITSSDEQYSSSDTSSSNQVIINSGTNVGNDNTSSEIIRAPEFKVEKFDINSIGFDATIAIEDDDNTLMEDSNIYILENSTGKTVYQYVESLGVYSIDLAVSVLNPNTEYTLVLESTYAIEDTLYTKNFIYKIFRTSMIGIDLEKDMFTDTSLKLALTVDRDTETKSVDVILSDTSGNTLKTQTIAIDTDNSSDNKYLVEFDELTSNTQYVVSLTNVLYDGQILTNGYIDSTTYKTLKAKPTIMGADFEIDKRDGNFVLNLTNAKDVDGGIQKYTFEIYDTRMTDSIEPIKKIETTSSTVTLKVDEDTIFRNVGYTYKVVVEFYDNEKIYEYESEYSNVMTMDGVEFPKVRFDQEIVTFERITGAIRIEDDGNAIDLNNNEFVITYTDSIGSMRTYTSKGSYNIPVDVNNLRANETYRFAVYATVDLQDGNDPIDECYIGGFVVQTEKPQNMVATFSQNKNDVQNTFSVNVGLQKEKENQGTLEAQTLTGMTISIYSGQTVNGEYPTGSPLRTIKLVDSNTDSYESDLKEKFFDDTTTITPAFFNADNSDFRDSYYTITVTNAYDYTEYPNQLPVINNVFTIRTSGYMPDLPADTDNALAVTAIRNYTQENPREDLADSTIVGYTVKATYDNSGLFARKMIYKAVDARTDALIETKELEVGSDGVIPEVTFAVLDGTSIETQDTDCLRRGNSYYFTYEILLDLNNDGIPETNYPYENDVVLKSAVQTPQKQNPDIYLYPKISTKDSITFKYKFNDVDNAVGNQNQVIAKINNATLSQKKLIETGDNFEEVTFENLRRGKLTLTLSKCLIKREGLSDNVFVTQYFESENSVSGLTYTINYDSNRMSINFSNTEEVLKYVTGIRVELEGQNSSKIVKDFQEIPTNNIISINYNELGTLLKTTTQVNVYAYYDSGIVGYETNNAKYVTYQKAYENEDEQIYYYNINNESKLILDTEAMGNMYVSARTENRLTLINQMTGRNSIVELTYSEKGFLYQGDVLLPKQINETAVACIGENTIYFDKIIPGISLKDERDEWQIVTELDKVSVKADLLIHSETEIVDNIIYIDLYQTDSQYKTEKFVKTIAVEIEKFDQSIQITDLQPQAYYFIKFRTILGNDNKQEETYIYDLDYQVSGRAYYFSTLADVGISDIQIFYEPVKYEEKYINISYTLEKTTGYDRIEYKLYHYNKENESYEEVMEGISVDQIFSKTMNKRIPIQPGSEFVFGEQYKLQITPIAEYTTLENENVILDLGTKTEKFEFEKLEKPTIAINGTRRENNQIVYRITAYDDDKVMVGNEYSVKIYNGNLEDVTPEEYKDKTFSIGIINNPITINDVESSHSYTILVTAKLDMDNNNIQEEYEVYTRRYTIPATNEYGIFIGELTINKSSQDSQKMEILFNNSYKLNEIDTIAYSIYNTNGYAQNGREEFIPKQIVSGMETYYTYTINEILEEYVKYYVELQFIKDDQVIENVTIEYVNIGT